MSEPDAVPQSANARIAAEHAICELSLRTGAWHDERTIRLPIPSTWRTQLFQPASPPTLSDDEIAARLAQPIAQPPVRELARGRRAPVIVVDDPNRPTPVARLLPPLLAQLAEGGVGPERVRIVVATGTHAPPTRDALARKLGPAAQTCAEVIVHDCRGRVARVGHTSHGTPVLVAPAVRDADLLIGVGGVYPNHTAGFGGGSKLALGVLGLRSIAALHYGHDGSGWGTLGARGDFRRDLDEIAAMIGLRTGVSVLLDGERNVVDLACGDPCAYWPTLAERAAQWLHAPRPDADADVVVANAYPIDGSVTFARMKGMVPLTLSVPGTSRVLVASCAEGVGFHGLMPIAFPTTRARWEARAIRAEVLLRRPSLLARKVGGRLTRRLGRASPATAAGTAHASPRPIWLYRPRSAPAVPIPDTVGGLRVTSSWDEIVDAVAREQGGRESLRVLVYACASMQWLA